jgi:DMSO/TMAO reductase YedYZ molybdopterin-dependent catalytic subunit
MSHGWTQGDDEGVDMPDGVSATTREREPGQAPPSGPARWSPSRGLLALAGAAAGLAGLLVSEAASELFGAPTGPVSAVAGAVRDLTPGRLAINLIHLVRHYDKPLLVGGTAVILLGLCAWAGSAAARRPVVTDLVFTVLAALGIAAELRLPNPSTAAMLAVVAGFITWLVAFRVLSKPLLAVPVAGPELEDRSRRDFLLRAGVVVVLSGAVALAGRAASSGRRAAEQARARLRLPVQRGVAPSGSAVGVKGIEPWRTPAADFYVVHTAIPAPSIAPADWKLRIHGMVENEITLDFDELVKRPLTEAWITLACVSNYVGGDLIGNAFWSGALLRDLLAEAKPMAGADAVKSTSKDGWTAGTPLSVLTDPHRNAMLAVAMNGEPLPVQHGFPVRMVVPGLYGYVSATKWVVDLEVTARACGPAGCGSAAAPGRSTPGSRRWSTSSTAAAGRRPSSAGCPTWTPGCSGSRPSMPRPVTTGCTCGRPMSRATCRPRRRPIPSPMAPPGGTRGPSGLRDDSSHVLRGPCVAARERR